MMRFCLLTLLLSTKVAGADCAMVEFEPNLLTPTATNLGERGGVVVAQRAFEQHPATAASTWRFRNGRQASAPTITSIAPGLDVYAPFSRGAKLVLEGGDQKTLLDLSAVAATAKALPIPTITAIKFRENKGRHSSAAAVVELAGDPPDGAVALVVYDKTGKPRSFGTVVKNAKQVTVYSQSDCGGPFQGTIISRTGDDVRLAWLDASGTLSKQTAVIRVRAN